MDNLVENNCRGRKVGTLNQKNYKWEVTMFDKNTNRWKEGKFCSINHLNQSWDLNLNSDYVRRIMYKYRADLKMRNKENSFLARWGHIKINKICQLAC